MSKKSLRTNIAEDKLENTMSTKEIAKAEQLDKQESSESKKENESFRDQFLRISADFANYKRRIEKERASWIVTAQGTILKEFLPIIDDLDRALIAGEQTKEVKDEWLKGLKMIQKNLHKILENLGVELIDCTKDFDPDYHEALMQVDSKKHKKGQIVEVLKPGYVFKGIVLQHAQVSVAK
jgi:molecular chaperone GrpE